MERIYDAGRDKLLAIGWLARIIRVVSRIRETLLSRLRALPAWQAAKVTVSRARARLHRLFARNA